MRGYTQNKKTVISGEREGERVMVETKSTQKN